MRFKILFLAFALALAASITAHAQTVALNIGPSGYTCGSLSSQEYCLNIPAVGSNGASAFVWLDAQNRPTSFIQINGITYPIVSPYIAMPAGSTGHLHYDFGLASSIDLDYTTYKVSIGCGRSCGWKWRVLPSSTMDFRE